MSHGGDEGLHEEHEEHVNHEAWVIPYADLLTLLMAMFIALFAMSTVDMDKFKSLAIGFNEALGGGELSTGVFDPTDGGSGPFEGEGSGDAEEPGGAIGPDRQPPEGDVLSTLLRQHQDRQVAAVAERASLSDVATRIERAVEGTGFAASLELRLEERGLVVTVVTDQVLFDSGSAALRTEGVELLRVVHDALEEVDNPVVVEGHTDARPISTAQFPSNWELSGARAGAVARLFQSLGLDPARMRFSGYGETRPVGDNATPAGQARNRRVEILVESKLVEQTLDDAGLGRRPVVAPDPVPSPIDDGPEAIRPSIG
jgi:chemotaxis protein MotB